MILQWPVQPDIELCSRSVVGMVTRIQMPRGTPNFLPGEPKRCSNLSTLLYAGKDNYAIGLIA